jgi:hypothetical protein
MDSEQKKIVHQLYKKGRKNLSSFDKLLIEANPEIKDELAKLFAVDAGLYKECNKRIEKAIYKEIKSKKSPVKRGFQFFLKLAVPATAAVCLFFIIQQVFFFNSPPRPLGGKVSLFITNPAQPGHFYPPGSSFRSTDVLQLAFQPPLEVEKIRQGVIFSASDTGENRVYYRYDSQRDRLNQREQTVVAEKLELSGESEFIYFIAYFSATPFREQERVDEIMKIILDENQKAAQILTNKFKADAINIIYIKRSDN